MHRRNGRPILPQLVRIFDHLQLEGPSLPCRETGMLPARRRSHRPQEVPHQVLMDGGSGLNILYVDTLDAMRIPPSELRLAGSPFHGVIPGAQAYPLGQIDLPVTFDNRANFRSEVMLRQVHGNPQLHLPQAEDARTKRRHNREQRLLARLHVRPQAF